MAQPIPPDKRTREEIYPYLRETLAELFDTPAAALAVADAAGVARSRLLVDGPVDAIWDRILIEARKSDGATAAILSEARRQYPGNVALLQAIAGYVTAQDKAQSDQYLVYEISAMRDQLRDNSDALSRLEARAENSEGNLFKVSRSIFAFAPVRSIALILGVVLFNLPVVGFIAYTAHDHGVNIGLVAAIICFSWAMALLLLSYAMGMLREPMPEVNPYASD